MAWTLYQVIGLDPTATPAEVASRCRSLLVRLHPDRGGGEATLGLFLLVQHAQATLTDAEARAAYDERLRRFERTTKRGGDTSATQPSANLGGVILDRLTRAAVERFEQMLRGSRAKGGES